MPGVNCNMGPADVRTNLIINYLHQSTTDEDLRSLFSTVGAVESARVILDKVKGHSLQYGFVNYMHHADAATAVGTLNRHKLQSKPIKVSYAQKHSPAAVKDTKAFIDGLPKTVTDEELEQRFSGMKLTVVEEANTCLAALIKQVKAEYEVGKQQPDDPTASPGAADQQADEASLTTTKQLNDHQNPPGASDQHSDPQVVEAVENFSKLQLYHGDLDLQNPPTPSDQCTEKQAAEEAASKQLIDQEPIKSSPCKSLYPKAKWDGKHRSDVKAEPNSQHRKHHQGGMYNRVPLRRVPRIFIYNLGQDANEEVLLEMFGNFGVVTDVKVIRDLRTNQCRGLAFVTMATYKQAIDAITGLNGYPLGDNVLQVSFKIQDGRRERQTHANHTPDFHHKERAVFRLSDNSIQVTVPNKKRARYTLDDLERDGHTDNHHYVFSQAKRQRAARMC